MPLVEALVEALILSSLDKAEEFEAMAKAALGPRGPRNLSREDAERGAACCAGLAKWFRERVR